MSVPKQPVQKQLLPFQNQNISANQQGVPLPYLAGTRVVAVTWISPALDQITHKVPNQGKKG